MDESQTSIAPSEPWPFDRHDEEARAKYIIGEIERKLSDGQEESAASLISLACGNFGKWRSANVLWMFYKRFTDPAILYRCIIDTYTNDGYNFPPACYAPGKEDRAQHTGGGAVRGPSGW